jgi:hypothetical protein
MRVTSLVLPADRTAEECERHADQEERRLEAHSSSLDPSKQTNDDPHSVVLPGYSAVTGCDLPGRLSVTHLRHRHSSTAATRRKIWDALGRLGRSLSVRARFAQCGQQCSVLLSPNAKEAAVTSNNCRSRWCPACGRDRSATIAANLAALAVERKARFVTLTRRHSHAPLTDQINSLYECFKRLRSRPFWQKTVRGGAAFLEVHRSDRDHLWHVHLHLLVSSDFLDQRQLSSEWLAVTSDSSIVDVRAIPDAGHVARYVAKYVSKPASPTVYNDPDSLDEMMRALQGRRLCLTFGDWRGCPLEPDEAPPVGWATICPLGLLYPLMRDGDAEALTAWSILVARYPSLMDFAHPLAQSG